MWQRTMNIWQLIMNQHKSWSQFLSLHLSFSLFLSLLHSRFLSLSPSLYLLFSLSFSLSFFLSFFSEIYLNAEVSIKHERMKFVGKWDQRKGFRDEILFPNVLWEFSAKRALKCVWRLNQLWFCRDKSKNHYLRHCVTW